jgi:ribonuclease P/MRP protein subunit RPP1
MLLAQPSPSIWLLQACSSLDVDIISLDLSQRLPFRLRPGMLKTALSRGLVFEVCYSGAVVDEDARKLFTSNLQVLIRCLRGKVCGGGLPYAWS